MNCFSSPKCWLRILVCTILLISGVAAIRAQVSADQNRPPAVPEGYVATPMGYFHESCVLGLAEGDIFRKDEMAIEHRDGSSDSIPPCAFPHYTPAGERVSLDGAGAEPPYIEHEYVEYADMKKSSEYYGELRANWTVPEAPTYHGSQIIYLFPGLEDYNDAKTTILQPVLGWNVVFKDGPNFPNVWTLSSWNCCENGDLLHSAFIKTEVGHDIFGQIALRCTPGETHCGSFEVNTVDQTTGKSTQLPQTSSYGLTLNWAFAGALEVYDVYECEDYPASGSTEFYFLGLFDQDLQPVTQGWKAWKNSSLTPKCGYSVSGGFKSGLPYVKVTYADEIAAPNQ
jgi:hypothetical protein